MKKKYIILITLYVFIFCPFVQIKAQDDTKKPAIGPVKPLKPEGITLESLSMRSDSSLTNSIQYLSSFDRLSPVWNSNANLLRFTPFYLNYNVSEDYKVLDKQYITPYNKKETFLGLGDYKNVGIYLKWSPSSWLSLKGGTFISLQYGYLLFSQHKSFGYNGEINFDINRKLHLNIYGQYMMNDNKDPFLDYSNLFPKTNVGASLEYKSQENSKIEVGMEYQYDRRNQKWKPEAKGKVSFGF